MSEKILMKGNEAIGEAAVVAGCRHYFGYPITPQSELIEYMAKRLPQVDGVFLQAESEVAAINMVYGAASAGCRVMTSSSSPGISLKQEGISYIAGSQLPCVIVNVQRGGPGLGSIQPGQADYFQATKGGGHGDYRNIVLAPNSVQEMADITIEAFDLADKWRNAVMILGDGALGQMMEPVEFKESSSKPVEKPWAATGRRGRVKPSGLIGCCWPFSGLARLKSLHGAGSSSRARHGRCAWKRPGVCSSAGGHRGPTPGPCDPRLSQWKWPSAWSIPCRGARRNFPRRCLPSLVCRPLPCAPCWKTNSAWIPGCACRPWKPVCP